MLALFLIMRLYQGVSQSQYFPLDKFIVKFANFVAQQATLKNIARQATLAFVVKTKLLVYNDIYKGCPTNSTHLKFIVEVKLTSPNSSSSSDSVIRTPTLSKAPRRSFLSIVPSSTKDIKLKNNVFHI